MADVDHNIEVWNTTWDWSAAGDEWSDWWGGTPAVWFGALLPRIHTHVPTGTILEIGPGYGRWTQYLLSLCERLVAVDLAERCVEHCRARFADADHLECHRNDGRSLDMVEDGSVDFAFSFDSLVHAEADVIDDYLAQLARKLAPDGVGFFHHSNIGRYPRLTALTHRTPERVRRPLVERGVLIDIYAWRAESMTAARFAAACERAGLACVSQEEISWQFGPHLTDTLSVFTRRGSSWERPRKTIRNRRFRDDAKRMCSAYAQSSFPRAAGDVRAR
jgi:SAM-dependent methyltransferase